MQGGARGRRVALVEDQVQHLQDGGQPFVPVLGPRRAERHTLDLRLGPADALRRRRLGDEQRTGDLRRRQTADRPQRQRDLRGGRQHRVAAEEQQGERVVLGRGAALPGRRCRVRVARGELCGGLLPASPRLVAAQLVGEPSRGDPDQPAARIVRHAALGPLLCCGEQGFLHGVLRGREVPVPAHQRAEDLRGVQPQQVLDPGRPAHRSLTDGLRTGAGRTAPWARLGAYAIGTDRFMAGCRTDPVSAYAIGEGCRTDPLSTDRLRRPGSAG